MNIHITLDYELFLDDRVGTVQCSLVKPMREFDKVCQQHGVRATIFVDAAYLLRLTQLKGQWPTLQQDYDDTVANIQWLETQGHDIELHIHPQWYYSTYDEAGWHLDWEHYKLSTAPYKESKRLFTQSKQLLDAIIGRKTQVFRAGGYSIQQFNYPDCFLENGILADSSVLTGRKVLSETHYYDYSNAPFDTYRFSSDILKAEEEGSFIEFPISCFKCSLPYYINVRRQSGKQCGAKWGDGGANPKGIIGRVRDKINGLMKWTRYNHASIDDATFTMLPDVYAACKRTQKHFVIKGHPKEFTVGSISMLNQFIPRCQAHGDTFTTLSQELPHV